MVLVLTTGGDDAGSPSGENAFITRMVANDTRAIALSQLALERAKREETALYAEQTVQRARLELDELDSAHEMIFGEPLPTRGKVDPPRLPPGDFDRRFIDALIALHQGAIRIAEAEINRGADPDLKMLARQIVRTRKPQIGAMGSFRFAAFGVPVPTDDAPEP